MKTQLEPCQNCGRSEQEAAAAGDRLVKHNSRALMGTFSFCETSCLPDRVRVDAQPIPLEWEPCSTGGGCEALASECGRFLITLADGDNELPIGGEPANLGIYDDEGAWIGWVHCATLEVAKLTAEMVAERWKS